MTQIRHKKGCYYYDCLNCLTKVATKYYCYAATRKFCSRHCADSYRRSHVVRNQYGLSTPWTKQEEEFLCKHYPTAVHPKELAAAMNRSFWSLDRKVKELGLLRTPETKRQSYSAGGKKNKGRPRPDFIKNGFRGSGEANPFYGKTHSAEIREKLSRCAKKTATFKRLAKDPEFQRKRILGLHRRPNKPEEIILALLDSMFPREYSYVGDGGFIIDGLNPDFINATGKKKVIEVFGETYHDPQFAARKVPYRQTEAGRTEVFKSFGYDTLVIWSKEIFLGGKAGRELLKTKIRGFHQR